MSTARIAIDEPRIAKLLFSDARLGLLWLPLRLYLGYMWFEAGWHKFVDPNGWAAARRYSSTGSAGLR